MNLFQRANVQSANNRYIIRQERIKREGSPYYSYTVGVVAAGDGKPLHELRIKNNDGSTSTTDKKIRLTLQRQPLTMDKWIRRQR